jgi:hypothetical protein
MTDWRTLDDDQLRATLSRYVPLHRARHLTTYRHWPEEAEAIHGILAVTVVPLNHRRGEPMSDKTKGLFGKYRVERLDGKPLKGDACIVLEIGDPNARPAILTWAYTVEIDGYSALAADVREMLAQIPLTTDEENP